MPILHIPLDERLHAAGTSRKGRRSWERYIHELIAHDIDTPTAPTLPADPAPKAPPPPAPDVVEVVVAPVLVAGEVEPCAPADPWTTADEHLRAMGEPDFQNGIPIGAGATLSGAASVSAESEWGVVAIRPEVRICDVPHVTHAIATLRAAREPRTDPRTDPSVADQPTSAQPCHGIPATHSAESE